MTTAENIKKLENGTKIKITKMNGVRNILALIEVKRHRGGELINIFEGARLTVKGNIDEMLINESVFEITGFSDNVKISISDSAMNMCEFEIE